MELTGKCLLFNRFDAKSCDWVFFSARQKNVQMKNDELDLENLADVRFTSRSGH